jgi:hypothetical protein
VIIPRCEESILGAHRQWCKIKEQVNK